MKWKKYTIETTADAEDLLSAELSELGVCGIEIEDKVPLTEADLGAMFVDIPADMGEDDGKARVSFYACEHDDGIMTFDTPGSSTYSSGDPAAAGGDGITEDRLLSMVREIIDEVGTWIDAGPGTVTVTETENTDWDTKWKSYWHAFAVDDVVIAPSWEEPEGELAERLSAGAALVRMDPGTAFGTGSHETTQLCIRALQTYLKPEDRILDVGTGSGILAVTACVLGAAGAFGTDLDELAVTAAAENAALNGVADRVRVEKGDLLDTSDTRLRAAAGTGYDIVTANILAPVIIELQKVITDLMKPGAVFIASGILDEKEEEVLAAIAANPGLEVISCSRQGEWRCVISRKVG